MRWLGIFILALSILAMPSYAALACGAACGVTVAGDGDDCCHKSGGQPDGQQDHQQHPGSKACPVCAFHIAVTISSDARLATLLPLTDLVPALAPSPDDGAHDAIFHPPRV